MITRSSLNIKKTRLVVSEFVQNARIVYLATNHDSPRYNRSSWISFNAIVQSNNVETVHELSFVLVNSLNLLMDSL